MIPAKRLALIAAISALSVVTFGSTMGTLGDAQAAPHPTATPTALGAPSSQGGVQSVKVTNSTSEPVPVAPQGTTNVSGNVTVVNPAASPVPVAQQGTVNVSGSVALSSGANTVKLDPSNNTVKIDPAGSMPVSGTVGLSNSANTVKLDSAANTVKLDSNTVKLDPAGNTVRLERDSTGSIGSVSVSGSVGFSSGANTVKLDPTGNTVKLDSTGSMTVSGAVGLSPNANTIKLDSSANTVRFDSNGNTVKIDPSTPITLGATVGLDSNANTVRIDDAYHIQHPLKIWGYTSLAPESNNPVNARNPIDPETHQPVPLLVQVVGGGAGGSAQQPVQFSNHITTGASATAYTVPAGKILKIEHVSVFGESDADWLVANIRTTMGGVTMQHVLPRLELESQDGPFYSSNRARVSAQVTFYADEGTNVDSLGRSAFGGGNGGMDFMFSGYLTNK